RDQLRTRRARAHAHSGSHPRNRTIDTACSRAPGYQRPASTAARRRRGNHRSAFFAPGPPAVAEGVGRPPGGLLWIDIREADEPRTVGSIRILDGEAHAARNRLDAPGLVNAYPAILPI